MSAAHTPGPWFISTGSPGQFHTVRNDETPVAHVLPLGDKPEVYANACLIAAAPELLAVLERLSLCVAGMDQFSLDEDFEAARDQARDAITKAKGTA